LDKELTLNKESDQPGCQPHSEPHALPAGLPPKQGLYDPQFEKDACGVGFVVNIKGQKSHKMCARR
jgi:hypothetical protein